MLSLLVGVPQVHHFGQEGLHNVLVIDLLGPNLEDLFDMCGRKFTIKTVCMSAKQMVSLYPWIGQVLLFRLVIFFRFILLFRCSYSCLPFLDISHSVRPRQVAHLP